MPIYEYQCQDCGHELEIIQKFSDDPATKCPQCKQQTLKKKVSAAAFRLSGGGWYETDFKSGDKKNLVQGSDQGSGQDKTVQKGDSGSADKPSASESTANATKSESSGSAKSDKPKTAAKPAKD